MDAKRKKIACEAALKAGAVLLKMRGKLIVSEEKTFLDFVSEADKAAEKIIISAIKLYFPEDGILSEESGLLGKEARHRWIIDPLDGTHNFLNGFKEFGVFIALEDKGRVIFSVCYFPALEELFTAEKEKGSFLNGKKIEVSKNSDLRGKMFCSDGILRKKPKEIFGDIEKFCCRANCRLRIYGSSPYSFTRVALGQALIATNRYGKPWDIAAPALIVEEAGGQVTDEKGNPWSVDSKNILATNGLVHKQSLKLFNS